MATARTPCFETYAVTMVTAGTVLLRVVSPLSKNKWVGALTRTEERVASWISGDGLRRGEGPHSERLVKEAQEKVLS
jgi:hypothetical protein